MSTFKIEGAKIIEGLFPESNWEELDSLKYQQVFEKLISIEQLSSEVVDYIKNKKVRIGFHQQYKSGAGWTLFRNITLTPGANLDDPSTLCLIIHEVFHLKQSILMRLSMRGELLAWQYQKQTYHQLTGKEIGDFGQAYPGTQKFWEELSMLSADSRDDLEKARDVMQNIARGYRSDCLPLYPLPREFSFYLRQGKIRDAIGAVIKLVTCK